MIKQLIQLSDIYINNINCVTVKRSMIEKKENNDN